MFVLDMRRGEKNKKVISRQLTPMGQPQVVDLELTRIIYDTSPIYYSEKNYIIFL